MPFEDGDVEANWYVWNGRLVVVYAGWDATVGEAQCPGNSVQIAGEFKFVSNSATAAGACDPEDEYPQVLPPTSADGARLCGGLVIYQTIIPTSDNGAPLAGTVFAGVERFVDGDFVGSTGTADLGTATLAELDPDADAYSVPDGWLADGSTEVTC
jgi:hypothetical protein